MDRDRIHRAAMGRRAAARNVDKTMRRRLMTYGVSIVIIAGWYILSGGGGDDTPERARVPLGELDIPDTEQEPRAKIDAALLDAVVRDGARSERALLEPQARLHLLQEAGKLLYGDLDKLGLEAGDWQALNDDPASARGRPFWTLGTLQWTDSETVDRLPTTRGELIDPEGNSWTFLVLAEPLGVEPGDVVFVSGFFMKQYDALRPDGRFVTAPLIVGEELLRSSFRIDPVTRLRPDLFDNVRDYDIEQASKNLESPEFYEALSYVNHAAPDVLYPPGEAIREVMPIEMLREPSVWRGEMLQATGVLMYMREAPLGQRGQNPLGIPLHWQLWVSDTRSGTAGTMLVVCLERPEVEEKDIVDIRGMFFRRLAFETKRQEAKMAAVILGHEVTRFVPGEDTITPLIMRIIVGLVLIVVTLLVIGQWRERGAAIKQRSKRLARKRKLVSGSDAAPVLAAAEVLPGGDAPAEGQDSAPGPSTV